MGCTVNFTNVSDIVYSCDELSTGGLKTVYLCDKSDLDLVNEIDLTTSPGEVTITSTTDLEASGVTFVTLGFNNKDGFSNFTDVKTVAADGTVTAVPTIQIEFLRMKVAPFCEDCLCTGALWSKIEGGEFKKALIMKVAKDYLAPSHKP